MMPSVFMQCLFLFFMIKTNDQINEYFLLVSGNTFMQVHTHVQQQFVSDDSASSDYHEKVST